METVSLNRCYTLLPTLQAKPRDPKVDTHGDPRRFYAALDQLVAAGGPIHLDLETQGLDATDPTQEIVCLGLANAAGCWSFITRAWPPGSAQWAALREAVDRVGWVAYNVPFDGAWLWRYWKSCGGFVRPSYCTYAAFRMLTTEGWVGQRWSLDTAVKDVLGWPSHKDVIGELLIKHGFEKRAGTPDRAEMWRLSYLAAEDFGRYCALDAEASWQLGRVFGAVLDSYPELAKQLRQDWVSMASLAIEQQHAGVVLDLRLLHEHYLALRSEVAHTEQSLRTHPQTAPLVAAEEARLCAEFYAPQVSQKRVRATPDECATLNRSVAEAKVKFQTGLEWPAGGFRWVFAESQAKSLHAVQKAMGGYWYREQAVYTPRNAERPAPKVNWGSDAWLRQVLYTLYPAMELPPDERHPKRYLIAGEHGEVAVEATEGGLPPVSIPVMPAFGEVGALLARRSEAEKEASYVTSYIEAHRGGVLHLRVKIPGTITGRLSGDGGVNFQQIPKSPKVMGAFQPSEDEVLVDLDFASLEPKVMAYFSQDPGYLELFASGRQHDVYLWLATQMFPELGIGKVYAPTGVPTAESIAAAKKQFKSMRDLAKRIHLATAYNAGAEKIYTAIRLSGEMPDITLDVVAEKRQDYWRIFAGIKDWKRQLEAEWEANGGWIYDGFGCPTAVAAAKLKDIVNTFTQKTGHNALLRFVHYIDQLRTARGVAMRPFLVDVHDATTWRVRKDSVDAAKAVFLDAMALLNRDLTPPPAAPGVVVPPFIPLTGEPEVGTSLWSFKGG